MGADMAALDVLRKQAAKATTKPVQPVSASPTAQGDRLTLEQLVAKNIIGRDAYNPLFQQLGRTDWQTQQGGNDENGNPLLFDQPNEDAAKLAKDYTFGWNDTGTGNTGTLTAYDPTGAQFGAYQQKDQSSLQSLGEWAALAAAGFGGAGLLGLGPMGGLLGGAGGAASGAIAPGGAGELAAYGASLTPAEAAAGALSLDLGGGAGLVGAGIGAGEGAAQLAAYTAANPVTAQTLASTMPTISTPIASGMGGLIGANEGASQLAQYTAANPVTNQTLAATLPNISAPATALGTTGLNAMRQGELAGYATNGAMPSSAAVATGGGLLGGLGEVGSGISAWVKENPLLAKLGMTAGTSLLSAAGGGGSSGGGQSMDYGPAQKWNSPIQQGLLGQVQQVQTPTLKQPQGLLAQGQANDGAWRWMRG